MNTVSQGVDGIIVVDTKESTQNNWRHLVGGIGFASGVVYSFYNKTGFWKGFGISIICAITGSVVGRGIDEFTEGRKK